MKSIVEKLVVNYEMAGDGRVVLMLHGWGDDLRSFQSLQVALGEKFKVVALDLPGFGGTQAPSDIWGLDNYANFVALFITKLGLNKPYAIIGHSNGGAVAIMALGSGRLKSEKLVLIASSGIRDTNHAKRFITKTIAKSGKVATYGLPKRYKQRLRKKLYGVIGSDLLVAPKLQETFKKTVRQDVQAQAAEITIPVLLLFARDDPAIPIADGRRYHELMKNSKLIEIDGYDHFIHLDKPQYVLKLIKEFL